MKAIEELNKACDMAQSAAMGLLKSHVKEYTRGDGTVVQEHDDSRQKHNMADYYGGDHKELKENVDYYGSHEKHAFALGWMHENHKFKGYQLDPEPTKKQLGTMSKHYEAGKKHAKERTSQGYDADAGMHDAFDRHMGRQ